jgi:hypothetical protein
VNNTLGSSRSMIGTGTAAGLIGRTAAMAMTDGRIGIGLVVLRDDARIVETWWHILREPFLRAGREFRGAEEGSIMQGIVSHAIRVALTGDHTLVSL